MRWLSLISLCAVLVACSKDEPARPAPRASPDARAKAPAAYSHPDHLAGTPDASNALAADAGGPAPTLAPNVPRKPPRTAPPAAVVDAGAAPAPVVAVDAAPAPKKPASGATAPGRGESCGPGDTCAAGLQCLTYYGIAGARGPAFTSCETPCPGGKGCPKGTSCMTVADGPGQVCR